MTPFLQGLAPPLRRRLTEAAEERDLADGEVLVRRGEHGGDLFLVVAGSLEAREGASVLSVCRPGQIVGEVAFLDGGPRSAALVAVGPSRVWVWRRDPLQALLERDPALHAAVLTRIGRQQASAVRRLTAGAPVVAAHGVAIGDGRFVEADRTFVGADGTGVKLSPTESRLLAYLVARPGRTVPHRLLLDEVWGYSSRVSSRTVYATVHRLRAKIEADAAAPCHIVAVRGGGYRFEPG